MKKLLQLSPEEFFITIIECAALTSGTSFIYELCHGTGYDAAQNAGDKELGHALHADQQHHEHEGVRSALDGHEVLHVVTAVEGQHDPAHEEHRVQERGAHGTEDVAPSAGLIKALQAAEDQAAAQAHQHTHAHTQDKGVDGAHLKQCAGHGGSTSDSVIEAHCAEHTAQQCAHRRAHGDGTHCNGKGQEAHVQRAHRHTAQTHHLHDQLNGNQQRHTGKSFRIFHIQFSSCCRSALYVGYGANLPALCGF